MRFEPMFKRQFRSVAITMALVAAALFTHAQTPPQTIAKVAPQITRAIDPAVRQTLGNSVPPLANAANDRGRADGSTAMRDMVLLMQPSKTQSAALKKSIDDRHNASSPDFHKWLTPEQFAAQFGAADEDIKTVSQWLASNGFTVDEVAHGKGWIRFSGTAVQLESAFKTSIHTYSIHGASKFANATPLSIPAALAPAVAGIVSANNFESHPQHTPPSALARNKAGKLVRVVNPSAVSKTSPAPDFTGEGDQQQNFLAPSDFAHIYNTQPLLASSNDGSGTSIAIVGRSDIELSDVEAFRSLANLPFNDPTIIYATTDPGDVAGDDVEATLDVEWSGAIAPQAQIKYVIGATTSTTDGVDIAASYAVDNVTAPILSLSFGLCEANVSDVETAFYSMLWQQAAVEGITVLVASGDAGSSGCNSPENSATIYGFGVNGLASTAYTVAVGGTEFNDPSPNTYWSTTNGTALQSAKGYIPEAVWNESCTGSLAPSAINCYYPPYELGTFSGGGGASSCTTHTTDDDGDEICVSGNPKPSWQTGSGVPKDGVRDLPDVALAAAAEHDGYLLCIQGSCQWSTNSDGSITLDQASIVGGTSAATPAMAGIMALIEQKHGLFQGVANYQLYKIAAAQQAAVCDSSKQTDPTKTSACVFNDITTGSNAVPCATGSPNCDTQPTSSSKPAIGLPARGGLELDGYSAVAGYDLASGLGSVNAANLVAAWGANSTVPSATTLTLSSTTFKHGSPITFTTQVAPATGTGTPSGDVTLKASKAGNIFTGPLDAGKFTGSTINLPGGTYTVTAQYAGDATYGASASSPVSVTVSPEASAASPATYVVSRFLILGQHEIVRGTATQLSESFWIQVQINGVSGSTGATGNVELSYGSTSIGSYPLDRTGQIYVQCGPGTPCDLGIGNYTFTAKYSGDASFHGSVATFPFSITQGVIDWETFVNNQLPPTGSKIIATTYFSNDPLVIPTGTVTLTRSDTGAILGSGPIDKTGVSAITFAAPSGDYFVNAAYKGDKNYIAGYQEISDEVITSDAGATGGTLALNLGVTTPSMGQHTQYSVTVTPAKGSTKIPIGFVTLYSNYAQIAASLELQGGKAIGNVEWDQVGPQKVYAVYSGDNNYAPTTSAITSVTVAQALPIVNVQIMSPTILAGTQTSITASLSSAVSNTNVLAPTGTIQFFDSLNGAAPQAISTPQGVTTGNGGTLIATVAPVLAQGSHIITALYSGDFNWKSATGTAKTAIVAATPSFLATTATPTLTVTAGQTATLTVDTQSILGFSTPITVACTGTLPVGIACNSVTVEPGASAALMLTTTAPGTTTATSAAVHKSSLFALSGTAAIAGLCLICIPNRKRFYHLAIVLLLSAIAGTAIGCGGNSSAQLTSMSVTSSNTKTAAGTSVTLQAILQSGHPLTGTVTFYDGSTSIGTSAAPENGIASISTSSLSVGTHAITAKYSGDPSNLASSSSDTLEQTITGPFTITVNATAGPVTQALSIAATLQ